MSHEDNGYLSFIPYIDEFVFDTCVLGEKHPVRICECCGHEGQDVLDCPSQTRYPWDGTGEDPNRDRVLCWWCATAYSEQIESQWADYYGGLF